MSQKNGAQNDTYHQPGGGREWLKELRGRGKNDFHPLSILPELIKYQ